MLVEPLKIPRGSHACYNDNSWQMYTMKLFREDSILFQTGLSRHSQFLTSEYSDTQG